MHRHSAIPFVGLPPIPSTQGLSETSVCSRQTDVRRSLGYFAAIFHRCPSLRT